MNFFDLLSLAPKIMPLMPRIEKAIGVAQKIITDPAVKDALAVAAEVSAIFDEYQKSKTVAAKTQF